MKTTTFLFAILQVTLSFLQSANWLSMFFENETKSVGTIIGLQITILLLYIGIQINLSTSDVLADIRSQRQILDKKWEGVTNLKSDEFYAIFEKLVDDSTDRVSISHLDTQPPPQLKNSHGDHYYKKIKSLIKANSKVRFQRVERLSSEKLSWIDEWISWGSGQKNFSLALLSETGTERELPHISVQLIDDLHSFLVAVSQQDATHTFRDQYIKGHDSNLIWRYYFDEVLWKQAEVVIGSGKVNQDVYDRLIGRGNE